MRNKISIRGLIQLLKEAGKGFSSDKVVKMSGALAYFTVFSIGPMMIVIIFLADIFYGREAIEGTVYGQLKGFVGPDAALQIQDMIRNATLHTKSNVMAVIGFITLLIGATTVFAEIQDSINSIWGLKAKAKKGWLKMLANRLLSFSIVVALGFILLVSLVINGLIEALGDRLLARFEDVAVVFIYLANLLITFFVITLLFAIIFKVLPDAKINWRDVGVGAFVTALLFMIGKFAITFYIGSSNIGSTYGTAGAMVVLLLWVYFSAIILYFGAEFTKVYAVQYGSRIHPTEYAVWIKQVEVEEGRISLKQEEQKKKDENENTGDHVTVK